MLDTRSAQRRVFAILAATAVPLLVLSLALVYTLQAAERAGTREDQRAVARAGAVAVEAYLRGNLHLLSAVAERYAGVVPGPPEVDAFLDGVTRQSTALAGVAVTGGDGVAFAASMASSVGADLSARASIEQALQAGQPVISAGFYSPTAQRTVITVNVPVALAGGEPGVVVGAVTLDDLADALATLVPQEGSRIAVVDQDGQLLVSPTDAEPATLADVAGHPAVRAAWATEAASAEAGSVEHDADGEERLASYVKLDGPVEGLAWVVYASEPASQAYAPARVVVRRGLLLTALTVAGVVVVGWLLGRSLSRAYAETAEAHQEAEEALKIREEFLAVAAHELRNPVASIRGAAQLLERRYRARPDLDERDREYMEILTASTAHLGRLVDDLLDVARLEQGQVHIRPERLDLRTVVHETIATTAVDGHRLSIHVPHDPVPVEADRDRVMEVVANLLENAAKYSPHGATVTVRVTVEAGAQHGTACVAVTDQGVGFTPDEATRLFMPFGRTATARASGVPGLGLGLYISRGLAEAHGGTLEASSPGRGQGATFTLNLPVTPPDLLPEQPSPDTTMEA